MRESLSGKAVCVTGASAGIGREAAVAFAREGARVALVARRRALLEEVAREIQAGGGRAFVIPGDLREPGAARGLIRSSRDALGGLDILVNNAGEGYRASVESTPEEVVRDLFELNFFAVYWATQEALQWMRKQGSGQIINVSSVAGKRGLPLMSAYSATKFALDGFTQALRSELLDSGIRVTLVNPIATATDFHKVVERRSGCEAKPFGWVQTAGHVGEHLVRMARRHPPESFPSRISRAVGLINALFPRAIDRLIFRLGERRRGC